MVGTRIYITLSGWLRMFLKRGWSNNPRPGWITRHGSCAICACIIRPSWAWFEMNPSRIRAKDLMRHDTTRALRPSMTCCNTCVKRHWWRSLHKDTRQSAPPWGRAGREHSKPLPRWIVGGRPLERRDVRSRISCSCTSRFISGRSALGVECKDCLACRRERARETNPVEWTTED